jgi:hypothetical protein
VSRNNFTQTGSGSATGFDSGLDSADIAADHDAHQTGTDLLGTDEHDIRRFDHSIRRFDSGNQTASFNHT